jgi:hypothetical protein
VTYVPEDDDEKDGVSRQTTHGFAPGDVFMVFEYVDYDLSGLLKCRDVVCSCTLYYCEQICGILGYLNSPKIAPHTIYHLQATLKHDTVLTLLLLSLDTKRYGILE